ncbi:MAG TPA: saccharopine dehydrogenase NADP-binding domain-containing protein [Actinomycetes bacterium]|nr:saccharopine dehydrogenase NADP-binding domain-containing protein [Actinomycetes bacterium]
MTWMLYGSYGYTGRLVAAVARSRGHEPLLAGRDPDRLAAQASELGLPHQAASLTDVDALTRVLRDTEVALVAHCAGPYSATADPMARACLAAGVPYLDVTGEIDVFEALLAMDGAAKQAGIAILPGSGMDVVPTDCLAAQLKDRLPGAVRLELAFLAPGGMSPGTAKTGLEGAGKGGRVRIGGELVTVPLGWKRRTVPFPTGPVEVGSIPWGDVSTAYHSTGIPHIVVYTKLPGRKQTRMAMLLAPVAAIPPIRRRMQAIAVRKITGPSAERRAATRTQFWGRVENATGEAVELTATGPNGYDLTADAVVRIVERVLAGRIPPGAHTPAQAHGKDFIAELDGITLANLA